MTRYGKPTPFTPTAPDVGWFLCIHLGMLKSQVLYLGTARTGTFILSTVPSCQPTLVLAHMRRFDELSPRIPSFLAMWLDEFFNI